MSTNLTAVTTPVVLTESTTMIEPLSFSAGWKGNGPSQRKEKREDEWKLALKISATKHKVRKK